MIFQEELITLQVFPLLLLMLIILLVKQAAYLVNQADFRASAEAAALAAAPGAAALADAEPPPFSGILPARFSYDLGNKRIRSVMPHETHPR